MITQKTWVLYEPPNIFLFDEITRGIDPQGANTLRSLIYREIVDKGRTAVIATHDLTDVTQLCTRVIAMKEGRIVGDGQPQDAGRLIGLEVLGKEAAG